MELFDAHCHLGWFADPARVAAEAAAAGLGLLAVTVTPAEHTALADLLADAPGVRVAAGLHPWWLADGRAGEKDVDALVEAAGRTRWVGEVGLDFSPRRVPTEDARAVQVAALERVCAACARESDPAHPHVLSLHAVRASGAVLDVLERTGAAARCRCVLHWFSGSSQELSRALALGCWASLGERALATRRGRAYARAVPAERLLTETDLPEAPGTPGGAEALAAALGRALLGIAEARGCKPAQARAQIARNACELLA